MALSLTEEIIRNRVNLQHDNLEDVKALSLPGTYHEKVECLGSSLRKFTRLKSLDLSRNCIKSLKGLEHLKLLEKLNLYYNAVDCMEELERLRYNANLKELDLRLNPVTRTEPDYRLYMIHMLPNLQKLDDRGVRDRERHAALVHFSSSQATEMTPHEGDGEPPPRQPNPRTEMIRGVGKGLTALDDDDVAVLDLIARSGGDLNNPRPITGSKAKEPTAEEYSLEVLKSMDSMKEHIPPPEEQWQQGEDANVLRAYNKKYPNIPVVNVTQHGQRSRHDENLQYEDEAEAYNKFKSHGYFTPHPNSADEIGPPPDMMPSQPRVQTERRRSFGEDEDRHRRSNSAPARKVQEMDEVGMQRVNGHHETADDSRITGVSSKGMAPETPKCKEFLLKLLDLVDRYWNGTKSLHKHAKFKALAYGAIENFNSSSSVLDEQEQRYLREQVSQLQDENYKLRKREEVSRASLSDSSVNETQLKASLTKAYKDVDQLKEKLQKYVNDNRKLQLKLQETEQQASTAGLSATSVNQTQIDELRQQNEIMRSEVEMLQIRLKQYSQLQELTGMLQESHKSLVQTNDHLIKELDQTKRRHQHEIQQMNWSYEQLKKSMNLTSNSTRENTLREYLARDGGSSLREQGPKDAEKLSGSALFYGDQDAY